MKKVFFLISITALFFACNAKKEAKPIERLNAGEIEIGDVVHDSLTPDQYQKIEKIHSVFAEVDGMSLKETITDFKRDSNPDNEIDIWLHMANAYQKYIDSKNGELNLEAKKEVYKLVLSRSMMTEEEAIANSGLKILTEKEAKEVLGYYNLEPDPIKVGKRP